MYLIIGLIGVLKPMNILDHHNYDNTRGCIFFSDSTAPVYDVNESLLM